MQITQKSFFILILCLVLTFTGCQKNGPVTETTVPNPIAQIDNAADLYTAASAALSQQANMTLTVSATETYTNGNRSYTQGTAQTVLYKDIGKESAVAVSNKVHRFGTYEVYTGLAYQAGTGYFTIADGKFHRPITMQEFSQQHAPAALFTTDNYQEITGVSDGIITTITFSKPVKGEAWSVPEHVYLLEASGSAILDANNKLLECLYSVTYRIADRTVKKMVRTTVDTGNQEIDMPDTDGFIPLDNPEALLLMEQSIGYLLQAENIDAKTTEHILCDSYSDEWTQDMSIQIMQNGGSYAASLDVSSVKVNSGRLEDAQTKTQQKQYANGVLTDIIDGGTPTEDRNVRQQDIQIYFRELLMSTVLKSGHITGVTVTTLEHAYKIEFTANKAMANKIRQEVCSTLYNTPTLLDDCPYEVEQLTGYIIIDNATLLPLSSGIIYLETHYVADFPYHLSFETEQTYTLT